jgi:hypothetical protein
VHPGLSAVACTGHAVDGQAAPVVSFVEHGSLPAAAG